MAKKSVVVMVLFVGLFGIWMSGCTQEEHYGKQEVQRLTSATYDVAYTLALAFRLKEEGKNPVPALISLLQDENAYVRQYAALTLGRIRSVDATCPD